MTIKLTNAQRTLLDRGLETGEPECISLVDLRITAALERKGVIEPVPGSIYCFRVTDLGREALGLPGAGEESKP